MASSSKPRGSLYGSGGVCSGLMTDASSLVDLKAELFRKQEEASLNKVYKGRQEGKLGTLRLKGDEKEEARISKQRGEDDQEEIKVKEALNRKAKLYEALRQGEADDEGRFLVQFKNDQDSDEEGKKDEDEDEDDDWVDYEDALGRTRRCLRSDLPHFIRQDERLKKHVRGESDAKVDESAPKVDLMSEDMRRELLRAKWEKEEEENLSKRSVHYQDVRFDEARIHGAGFYTFSREEKERSEQREQLDKLHQETMRAREEKRGEEKKRKESIKERLKKVRDRKRLKMGLPILPTDEEEEKVDEVEDGQQEKQIGLEERVMLNLRELRESEEREKVMRLKQQRKRKAQATSIREWDVGKDEVGDRQLKSFGEKKVLSQEEWNQKKRAERPSDFAPPKFY